MEYVKIPRHNRAAGPLKPGFWLVDHDGNLWHKCPECQKGSVMQEHWVAADGKVTPSIACFAPCGYHVFGVLEDWNYGTKMAGKLVTAEVIK